MYHIKLGVDLIEVLSDEDKAIETYTKLKSQGKDVTLLWYDDIFARKT